MKKLDRSGILLFCFCSLLSVGVSAEDLSPPQIVLRSEWHAAEPKYELMHKQMPLEIIIHHTGELQRASLSVEKKLKNLQDFSIRKGMVGAHMKPAWGDLPYHYYIDLKGRVGEGRDVSFAGDTNTSYDTLNKIQIVVEGDFEKEKPTQDQLDSLEQLVHWLEHKYNISPNLVSGHNDLAKTDCPGKYLKPFVMKLKNRIN